MCNPDVLNLHPHNQSPDFSCPLILAASDPGPAIGGLPTPPIPFRV